jgi:glucose dehydrogenase
VEVDADDRELRLRAHRDAPRRVGRRRQGLHARGGQRVVALDKDTGAQVWVSQPTGPGGASLGNIAKVATVYYDGMIYLGGNDGNRNAAFAVACQRRRLVWSFYGGAAPGVVVTDVNGVTTDAGATWGRCRRTARAARSRRRVAVDPSVGRPRARHGLLHVRQRAQLRLVAGRLDAPGDNLFGNSVVAFDLKTGAYKWHFQSIRHDHSDMDKRPPAVLADVTSAGRRRRRSTTAASRR